MARLSSQQRNALQLVAEGNPVYGYLLRSTIPSLIKRGLVVTVKSNSPFFTDQYRLTQKGFEAYHKMRTRLYENKLADLEAKYQQDLASAKAHTA